VGPAFQPVILDLGFASLRYKRGLLSSVFTAPRFEQHDSRDLRGFIVPAPASTHLSGMPGTLLNATSMVQQKENRWNRGRPGSARD
jgi:hypothetical protein